jgi:erythritol kinase
LIDAAGEPVRPAWLWLDSRAAGLVDELAEAGVTRTIFPHTGCGLNACQQSVHLCWMVRHDPEALATATTAFHCKDWLYFKLTNIRATDLAEGTFTFGDFQRNEYDSTVIEALGLSGYRRLLPPMLDGSKSTHPLTDTAAATTGLQAGTPVSLGSLDVPCTALGGGLYDPNRQVGCSIIGSTGMHMRYFASASEITLAPQPTGYTMAFPVPGSVVQLQSNMAATLNIDWITDLVREAAGLFGDEVGRADALRALDGRVLEGRPGAALYHPYIHEAGERGPFVASDARAMITGLSNRTRLLDLVRSVYEGLALAARDCYGAMGHVPDEIRIAGGAARSRAFKAIMASALGVPLRESSRAEAGAAGAAMMAAVATGIYPDLAACARVWVEPTLGDTVAPDPALTALYDGLYPIYVATRQAMPDNWRALAELRRA